MLFNKKNKPRERFYLFPGQGGKNYFRKQMRLLVWSTVAALLFSGILAVFLWWFSHPQH